MTLTREQTQALRDRQVPLVCELCVARPLAGLRVPWYVFPAL